MAPPPPPPPHSDFYAPPVYAPPISVGFPPSLPIITRRKVIIPSQFLAMVIGKGGRSINEMRTQSNAKMKIVTNEQDTSLQADECMVLIEGHEASVHLATQLLTQRVEEERVKAAARI